MNMAIASIIDQLDCSLCVEFDKQKVISMNSPRTDLELDLRLMLV